MSDSPPEQTGSEASQPEDLRLKDVSSEEEDETSYEPEVNQSIRSEMTASGQEWLERRQSLDDLFADERPSAGTRDWIGRVTNRIKDGNVYVAQRDIHVDQGRVQPTATIHELTENDIKELRRTLVSTQSQAEARRMLDSERLVLLAGPAETGKATVALAALLDWGRRASWIIPHGASTPNPRDWKLESGHGYLLDLVDTPDSVDRVTTNLKRAGVSADCRVIVLVPEHTRSAVAPVIDHDPPSGNKVFAKHLSIQADGARLAPEDQQLLNEEIRAYSAPWQMVGLAKQVAATIQAGTSIEEMLDKRFHRMRAKVGIDLDKRRPTLGRCFMTSIAVLHGLPEAEVSGAALALAERLDEKWRRDHSPRPVQLWEKLPLWLDYVDAEAVPAGPGGGRTIKLRRPKLAAIMLRVIWEDQPTIRDSLVDWLLSLGGEGSWHTRIRVGHAVGKLATFDFDIVDERFLRVWSRSRRTQDYQLAALALEAAAEDPSLTRRVHLHLQLMIGGRDAEKAIAIRAYASSVGLSAPDQALSAFRSLVLTKGAKFHQDVAQSIAYLYRVGTSHVILNHLADWVSDGGPAGRRGAALAFARLAAPISPTPERPHLSRLDPHPSLVTLWRNALSCEEQGRLVVPESWDLLLSEWLRHYNERPTVREVADKIFSLADGRNARRALFYLRLWRHQDEIPADLYYHLRQLVHRS
ncbi:hypothetical protein GCM10009530_70720 [Microbispora corallina]|uniref:Uncharacterized protein n=1 Tax=Microbispora corallina TaxID=83302 RepID=A0ABQ4GAF5_9ACTN|nr:hypothetical protein [Microbispora corallina]GIH44059.1 hypothetical protein Mco01_70590 [Microbispora corallina]